MLYGEAGDDLIDDNLSVAGVPLPSASLDLIDYGTDDGAVPTNFTTPPLTPNPPLQPAAPGYVTSQSSLPTGIVDNGRWGELSGSASGRGLNRDGVVSSPNIANASTNTVVAWTETVNGTLDVFVAQHSNSVWQRLVSTSGASVSNSATASTNPNITVATNGRPTVAWTERNATGTDIQLAQYDATANSGNGAWLALGTSLSANGLTATGNADNAIVLDTSFGLVVVWQNMVAGINQVYARVYNGSAWTAIGVGSDSAGGISGGLAGSDIRDVSVVQRGGRIAIAWSQIDSASGIRQVYLREYDGTAWNEISGSASGAGASSSIGSSFAGTITHNASPSVAYVGTDLFVSWQTYSDQSSAIVVAKYLASAGNPTTVSTTETLSRLAQPKLVSNGTAMQLVWLDGQSQIYAKRWNGTTMIEEITGDASGIGVSPTGRTAGELSAAIDATVDAHPSLGPTCSNGKPDLMVRRNDFVITGTVYQANENGTSIQQILSNQTLTAGDVIVVNGTVSCGSSILRPPMQASRSSAHQDRSLVATST